MQAKHTPGPWKVFVEGDDLPGIEAHHQSIILFGRREFVEDHVDDGGIRGKTRLEEMANARLIAAAPELLEALQDLLNAESSYPYGGMSESEITAAHKAHAAIKKALEG